MKRNDILNIYRATNTIFNLKDIAFIWGETNFDAVKARINYYVKKDKLYSPRKGFYARDKNYDPLELGTKIYTPSYLSLETVLKKEGIIFQYSSAITIISYLSRRINFDGNEYVYRKIKNEILLNPLGIINKGNIFIASGERAFLDCLYLNNNYHFDNLKPINWGNCYEIASIYENKKLLKSLESYKNNA